MTVSLRDPTRGSSRAGGRSRYDGTMTTDENDQAAWEAAVWTQEARKAYGAHLRHLAEHAGTIPASLDDAGRCITCLRLGWWRPDA